MITRVGPLTAAVLMLAVTASKAKDSFFDALRDGGNAAVKATHQRPQTAPALNVTSAYVNVKYSCQHDVSDPRGAEKGKVRAYWETLVLNAGDQASVTVGMPDFGSYQSMDLSVLVQGRQIGTLLDGGAPRNYTESCESTIGTTAIFRIRDVVSPQKVALARAFTFRPVIQEGRPTGHILIGKDGHLPGAVDAWPAITWHIIKAIFSESYRNKWGFP